MERVAFMEKYTPENLVVLKVKKLHPDAVIPTRGTPRSVGYDLYSTAECTIESRGQRSIPTGIAVQLPLGCYGRVASRSGLAVKHGLDVGAGVIDPDYTGEILVVMFNHSDQTVRLAKGQKVAQLILERCYIADKVEEVEGDLDETQRGSNGFGSTDDPTKRQKMEEVPLIIRSND